MRRLPTLAVLVLVFALLALTPVSAAPAEDGTEVWIAVPDYVDLDGTADRVVFTGDRKLGTAAVANCFQPPGMYDVRRLIVNDATAAQHGSVTGVLVKGDFGPGTQAHGLSLVWGCTENGISYDVYVGVTG